MGKNAMMDKLRPSRGLKSLGGLAPTHCFVEAGGSGNLPPAAEPHHLPLPVDPVNTLLEVLLRSTVAVTVSRFYPVDCSGSLSALSRRKIRPSKPGLSFQMFSCPSPYLSEAPAASKRPGIRKFSYARNDLSCPVQREGRLRTSSRLRTGYPVAGRQTTE